VVELIAPERAGYGLPERHGRAGAEVHLPDHVAHESLHDPIFQPTPI